MCSISFDGNCPIPIEIKPNENILAVIRKIKDPSKFVPNFLVLYKSRIIEFEKSLSEQGVTNGTIEVFPSISTTAQTNRKMLSEQIEELGFEASRIMDIKIEKALNDPHVMALCNTYVNQHVEDYYPQENQSTGFHFLYSSGIFDPNIFPTEKSEDGIPNKPLPMEWRNEQQLDFLAEPQEPLFSSLSEARKYYSNQITEHSWDW